jgi:hypothetical protein
MGSLTSTLRVVRSGRQSNLASRQQVAKDCSLFPNQSIVGEITREIDDGAGGNLRGNEACAAAERLVEILVVLRGR